MLGLFIAVADSCLKLQNYQSAMQIFSALNMSPVLRLKDEWKALPKRSQQMYAELQLFFASENNFRNYRNSMYVGLVRNYHELDRLTVPAPLDHRTAVRWRPRLFPCYR